MLNGCETVIESNPLVGLDDSTFEEEEEYNGELNTVGDLSTGYAENTTALRAANNKLTTICIAAKRCEMNDEE